MFVKYRNSFFIFFLLCLIGSTSKAWVADNRFLPEFYPHVNHYRTWESPSTSYLDGLFMVGHDAFDHEDDEKEVGIFDIFGNYDENKLAQAIVAIGLPDPFDAFPTLQRFRGQEILWNMESKIQAQGAVFQFEQQVWDYLWIGGSSFFLHLYSRINFELNPHTIRTLSISPEDQISLDQMRRLMNDEIGIFPPVVSKVGFSDIDVYLRLGSMWEYLCKFRKVDAGFSFGGLIPTGLMRTIQNPASIPIGGDGHWGVYLKGDLELELKEDWKAGAWFRINKRFKKYRTERLQVVDEQQLFGVVQGRVAINPGWTFLFAPYGRLENIREGFGLELGYVITHHMQDDWKDAREVQIPTVNLQEIIKRSSWTSEYVMVEAFFDSARILPSYCKAPIISFRWDVPIRFFAAKGAAKTNRIMLGIELNY